MAERSFAREVEDLKLGAGQEFRGEGILAITKALLECGVSYVAGYQGAPISHLMDVLSDAQDILSDLGVHFESSASEATAAATLVRCRRRLIGRKGVSGVWEGTIGRGLVSGHWNRCRPWPVLSLRSPWPIRAVHLSCHLRTPGGQGFAHDERSGFASRRAIGNDPASDHDRPRDGVRAAG